VTKPNSSFSNDFSMVLGILVVIASGVFMSACKPSGDGTDAGSAEVVTGSATAPAEAAASAPVTVDGAETYKAACSACHRLGINGAPNLGDKAAWSARLAQGAATLHRHAIEGYQGANGFMPAKGGRVELSDEAVIAALEYMLPEITVTAERSE